MESAEVDSLPTWSEAELVVLTEGECSTLESSEAKLGVEAHALDPDLTSDIMDMLPLTINDSARLSISSCEYIGDWSSMSESDSY